MECTLLYICASYALAENLKSVQSNLNLGYDFSTLKTIDEATQETFAHNF